MLLAAGHGRRMEPLSSVVAKPVLDVLGEPLLATALRQLAAWCEPLVVNLHRHPRQIAAAVRQALPGRRVRFSWEPDLLGGAGGLAAARRWFRPGPLLVGNADTFSRLDLSPLRAAADPDTIVLGLVPHPDPAAWSAVRLAADGRVTSILPAGASGEGEPFLFTGFQVLGAGVVATLPPPPGEMAPVWRRLRESGRLRGAVLSGWWREAGDPEAYRHLVVSSTPASGWRHPDATVGPGVELIRSTVGRGCAAGAGCLLRDSVVTAGAILGDGCEIERCVVAGGVRLPGGTRESDALLLPRGRFPLPPAVKAST
ncbi:MAG: NTP transferase domain-containing protein [Thermoanaerobaculaceae bacterium]|jgi:NDP-sugar pyrophosphorylase family protein|nr:NTP transferase domain-containing protein [Thermoanaerobaculaceae bacterium]